VNRASSVQRAPGGKAAHVAMALKALSAVPTWIGFAGGATGDELLAGLRSLDIDILPVPVAQSTRVNLEILDARAKLQRSSSLEEQLQNANGPSFSGSVRTRSIVSSRRKVPIRRLF